MQSPRRVVVIGGSAGAIEALPSVLGHLPADFPGAFALVVHRPAVFVSALAEVLGRRSNLKVVEPAAGEPLTAGRVYLAPRDHHMSLDRRGLIQLDRGPKQHHVRPAIDPLFESAATTFGARVIGVLLTGALGDGTRGLVCVKKHGGVTLAHDPREARFPWMPRNALLYDNVDLVFRVGALADLLSRLVGGVAVETLRRGNGSPRKDVANGWSSFDPDSLEFETPLGPLPGEVE